MKNVKFNLCVRVCFPRPTWMFGFYGNSYDGGGLKVERDEGWAGGGGWQGGRLQDALLQTSDT